MDIHSYDLVLNDDQVSAIREREEMLLSRRVPGVCKQGDKWRAYLHIGNVQVWHKGGFCSKSEAVDARLDAEHRFGNDKALRRVDRAVVRRAKTPQAVRGLEGVRKMTDGGWMAYHFVERTAGQGRKVFDEVALGEYAREDYGLACLHARAAVAGVDFDRSYFELYLDMYRQLHKIKADMDAFAQEALLPLLQLSKRAKPRRAEHIFFGYRWQQVRRYKSRKWLENGDLRKQRVFSGTYLRLVPERRVHDYK